MFSISTLLLNFVTVFLYGKIDNSRKRINKVKSFSGNIRIIYLLFTAHWAFVNCNVAPPTPSNFDELTSKTVSSNNLSSLFNMNVEQSSYNSFNTQFTNRLKRSSTNDSTGARVTELIHDMSKLRQEIKQIKLIAIDNGHKKRLIVLDNIIQLLRSNLNNDDENTTQIQKLKLLFVEEATNTINTFKTELVAIKQRIQETRNRLSEECIKDIEAEQFADAQEKFLQLTDSEINNVVKKAYSRQVDTKFDMLLKFADYVTDISRKFPIYSELYFEIERNGYNNLFMMIKLVQNLQKRIIRQSIHSISKYKTQAQHMASNLMSKIKLESKKVFKEAILNNRPNSTNDLADQISSLQNGLLKEIITDVVHDADVFGKRNATQLVLYMSDLKNFEQSIYGLAAIYTEIAKNDSAILTLAIVLKKRMEGSGYATLSQIIKSEYESLRNRIPAPLIWIASSSLVCIKNYQHGEYLFASDDTYTTSLKEHYVLAWSSGDRSSWHRNKFKWIFENVKDDIFNIRNVYHSEYMYAAGILTYKDRDGVLTVFNSISSFGTPSIAQWKVICVNDDFYLMNVYYNRFLTADTNKGWKDNDNMRHIFTQMRTNIMQNDAWKIENCN